MNKIYIYSFLFLITFLPIIVKSQDSFKVQNCAQKDLPDVINSWRKHPKPPLPEKSSSLLLIPSVTSNPATGLSFGVGGQYAFTAKTPGSHYSSINASANYTTKKQFLLQVRHNIFLKNDKVFISGDWRVLIFSQSTYGLGTSAPVGGALAYQFDINGQGTTDDSLVQPLKFNQLRFHQLVSWRVSKSLFLGFGYRFDLFKNIVDVKLDTARPLYTSHYLYNKKYGFDVNHYIVSALSLNTAWDTRDNLVNSYKGVYANINWSLNPEFLGNAKTVNTLKLEWRSFHPLSVSNPRHLIAFWLLGNFTEPGKLPYLALPNLGDDQRGRSGRGYIQGRFRGSNMVYSETEYRFPISPCGGILGGVLFVNMTTASSSDKHEKLFDSVAPGYGLGIRIMVDKKSRTNVQIDFGFGKKSSGVYFGAAETF